MNSTKYLYGRLGSILLHKVIENSLKWKKSNSIKNQLFLMSL